MTGRPMRLTSIADWPDRPAAFEALRGDMTGTTASRELGIPGRTWGSYVRGERTPPVGVLSALARLGDPDTAVVHVFGRVYLVRRVPTEAAAPTPAPSPTAPHEVRR
jgi:hypothetical protein